MKHQDASGYYRTPWRTRVRESNSTSPKSSFTTANVVEKLLLTARAQSEGPQLLMGRYSRSAGTGAPASRTNWLSRISLVGNLVLVAVLLMQLEQRQVERVLQQQQQVANDRLQRHTSTGSDGGSPVKLSTPATNCSQQRLPPSPVFRCNCPKCDQCGGVTTVCAILDLPQNTAIQTCPPL